MEACARGRRREAEQVRGEEMGEYVTMVNASAPSSPPVARRAVVGGSRKDVRVLMLLWWSLVRVSYVNGIGWEFFSRVGMKREDWRVRLPSVLAVIPFSDRRAVSGQNARWPSVLAVQR